MSTSFASDAMQAANRFWGDLGPSHKAYEAVCAFGPDGINGRAVAPLYTQCAHPRFSTLRPRVVHVRCGESEGSVPPRTQAQYWMLHKRKTRLHVSGRPTQHRQRTCYQTN